MSKKTMNILIYMGEVKKDQSQDALDQKIISLEEHQREMEGYPRMSFSKSQRYIYNCGMNRAHG